MQKERDSSIELLRIIAGIAVIVLHYNNDSIGKAFSLVNRGTINNWYIYFSESVSICAVDVFIMISAYFLCQTGQRKLSKVISLIVQLILIKNAIYFIDVYRGGAQFELRTWLGKLLPSNYFIILYSTLYMVSPYINHLLDKLDKKNYQKLLAVSFFLFSVWNTIFAIVNVVLKHKYETSTVGLYGSQDGYTIVTFTLLYLIGAYIRKYDVNFSSKRLLLAAIGSVTGITLFSKVRGDLHWIAWNYDNPLVIILGTSVLLLFLKVTFSNKIINELSKATFTCYLVHTFFVRRINIQEYVNGNLFVLVLHQIASACIIFLVLYIIYRIYSLLEKPIMVMITRATKKLDAIISVS